MLNTNGGSFPCPHVPRKAAMVLDSLPFENLSDIEVFPFRDDIRGAGDVDILVHVYIVRDSILIPNEPDWDARIKKALTDFGFSCEGPHPVVESHMEVTGRQQDWRSQIVEHSEYVETKALEQRDTQHGITKCEC